MSTRHNNLLINKPEPDFYALESVIRGGKLPSKVPLVELFLDDEVLQRIAEDYLGEKWIPVEESVDKHYEQLVRLYYRLGYDYVPVNHWHNFLNQPQLNMEKTSDTALLSRGERGYVVSGHGRVRSREDFERIPWEEIKPDFTPYEPVMKSLPSGMKVVIQTTFFQNFVDVLFGYDGLGIMLYDDPQLVSDAFEEWGKITEDLYKTFLPMDEVGAVFHADDMGFKTNTFLPRETYRKYLFPWLKRFVDLTHQNGKTFWLHCCGNVYTNGTIDDLLDDINIDAFHSFQDSILPVNEFKARYGNRCAVLGGVDMDNLCRMGEDELRLYIKTILDSCMEGGRFALGSGNTVTNYTPITNYAIMLEEARKWGGK